MNKAFSLFLFLLVLFIASGIESHPFIAQPNDCPPYWVPVYFNLNETKPISVYLSFGGISGLSYDHTINQSVIYMFRPNVLVVLESQYPFEVNGKPAWYDNGTANPFYFYEFRANESMTLNINFLPKPLPNTPVGYINLDSPTPVPVNETTSQIKPIVVKPTTATTAISSSSNSQFFIFLVLTGIIIAFILVITKK